MFRSFLVFLGCVCALLVSSHSANACDLCSVYSANRAANRNGLGFDVGVAEQFTHFGTLKQDGTTIANPANQTLDSSITQLFVSYQFLERLGAQFNLPIITRNFTRTDGAGGIQTGSVTGIGDVSLTGNFTALQKTGANYNLNWRLQAGIKFPSGSPSRLNEELTEIEDADLIGPASGIHGHDLALGSGSVDGMVGSSFYGQWRRLFVTAELQYALRTRGHIDYRYANDLHWSFSPGAYVLLEHTHTLSLQSKLSGEYKSLDDLAGTPADDTGITAVYLGPEIDFTWKAHLNLEAGADIPVLMHNTALQSVPDYRIRSAVSWKF
jgi:hypothetical protein